MAGLSLSTQESPHSPGLPIDTLKDEAGTLPASCDYYHLLSKQLLYEQREGEREWAILI
jgi:hypothetical protein